MATLSGEVNILPKKWAAQKLGKGLGHSLPDGQVLIRPEWLSVVPQTNSSVNGLIIAKQFKGSHVVYEVQLASQERVLVYSPTDVAILGESVGLLITHLPESRQ